MKKKHIRDSKGRYILTVEEKKDRYFASYGNMPYFSAYELPLKSSNIDDATKEAIELCKKDYERLLEILENQISVINRAMNALDGTPETVFPRENEFMAVV